MKIKHLLTLCLSLSLQVQAQTWVADSVNMGGPGVPPPGTSYPNDVYYSLKNGVQKTEPNANWHIAFQMVPQSAYGNVAVFANHVQNRVRVFPTHLSASASFASFNPADTTLFATAGNEVFNTDTSWNFGAFNRMADASNPFDYSWGLYDMASHNVMGDSLYLVKVGSAFYKFWIQEYVSTPADSVQWRFRIAALDGSGDTTIRIYRLGGGFANRLFAYYNITSKTIADREPARTSWDLLFTRYKEYIPGAPGVPYYNVTGTLSNLDVSVAVINNMPADSAVLDTVNMSFAPTIKEIGSNWKSFDNTTMTWSIQDSLSYFIKTKNTNEYYQLQFTGFGGSATGMIYFQKRKVGDIGATSVGELAAAPVEAMFLAPNPAHHSATLVLDAKEAVGSTQLIVADMTGRVIYRSASQVNKGMNAITLDVSGYAAGIYTVRVGNGAWSVANKLIVQP